MKRECRASSLDVPEVGQATDWLMCDLGKGPMVAFHGRLFRPDELRVSSGALEIKAAHSHALEQSSHNPRNK